MALNDRQERFCREYMQDYNATQAAIRAGYSKKTAGSMGHENLKKPEILARVRELQEEKCKSLVLSEAMIITELTETYRECRQNADSKGALRALEMLGKHIGMFSGTNANEKEDPSELYKALDGDDS